jgi:LPXTG-motif cell wall-anchored protein
MSPEWVVTGIILLGGMAAGGISVYLKRRKENFDSFDDAGIQSNSS